MAVNVKYTHSFKPTHAGQWRVNLCDTGFSGSSSNIQMTAEPFTLEWQNDDPHAKVISSECTLNFICETQAQVDWFADVAADRTGRYTVELLKGTSEAFFWAGVIQAESVTIPYLTPPLVVQVQANDDLARLADSFHNQTGLEGGVPYAETDELVHVHIRRCMSRLRIFHHWDSTDNFMQLLSYYESTPDGDGLTDLKVPSQCWDTSPAGQPENTAMSDLQVLEELCVIFNSRLVLHSGVFHFHSLAHLEQATNFEADVINYRKDGVLFSPVSFDLETSFDDITKLAGWSKTYLPALKQVTMDTAGGFIQAVGRVQFLPPWNQIVSGQNSLDGSEYFDVGSAQPFSLNGNGSGFFAVRQNEEGLLDFWLQASFDAFQLSESTDLAECIRLKVTVLLPVELYGANYPGTRYGKSQPTFDGANTQPIIGENGEVIETDSVTYEEAEWATTNVSTSRIVRFTEAVHCGGNNPRGFSKRFQIPLPALDAAANGLQDAGVPTIGAKIEVVKHDGTALSSANQTTIDAAWQQGYLLAPSFYTSQNAANAGTDSEVTTWLAQQNTGDFRETLHLGLTSFGFGVTSPAVLFDGDGDAVGDWTSPGNADGTDFIAQLVVKDVLRLRSMPREIFRGNGMVSNILHFPFNRIYTDSGTRYALLGCRIDGASNFSEVTFFQLNHDDSLTLEDSSDFAKSPWIAGRSRFGKGEIGSTDVGQSQHEILSALSFQAVEEQVQKLIRQILTQEERQRLNARLNKNGSITINAKVGDTQSVPDLTIHAQNTSGSEVSRDATVLKAGNPDEFETITLPVLSTTNGTHIMTMRTQGNAGTMAGNVAYGSTAGHVLTMVDVQGTLEPQFAAASASGGGFTAVQGYRKFKGSGAQLVILRGTTNTTDTTSATVVHACLHAGSVGSFVCYSNLSSTTSFSLRLYKNGTLAETETFTINAHSTITGTFSTSVAAGDRLYWQMSPVGSASGDCTLSIQISKT